MGWVEEVESGRWGEIEVEGWEIAVDEKGGTDTEGGGIAVGILIVGFVLAEVVGCRD